MEETLVFQEVFSMISNLIGPRKWIFLAKELEVYPHEKFNSEINKLNAMYKKPPRRVWTCLTEWRLGAGSDANVMDLLIALRNIKIHWLADKIQGHLEMIGILRPVNVEKLECKPYTATQTHSATAAQRKQTKFDVPASDKTNTNMNNCNYLSVDTLNIDVGNS